MRNLIDIIENQITDESEIIEEARLLIHDHPVNLQKNLGPASLNALIDRSRDGHVRGLIVGPDIYYWEAFNAVHVDVAQALGVPYDPKNRVEIWHHENFSTYDLAGPPPESAAFERILQGENFYFDANGNGEWIKGPDYAERRHQGAN